MKSFDKKKNLAKEKKMIREQKEEAEKFQALLKRRNTHLSKFFLWQLYQIQHKILRSIILLEEKKFVFDLFDFGYLIFLFRNYLMSSKNLLIIKLKQLKYQSLLEN
jgi:hypothetical protein